MLIIGIMTTSITVIMITAFVITFMSFTKLEGYQYLKFAEDQTDSKKSKQKIETLYKFCRLYSRNRAVKEVLRLWRKGMKYYYYSDDVGFEELVTNLIGWSDEILTDKCKFWKGFNNESDKVYGESEGHK